MTKKIRIGVLSCAKIAEKSVIPAIKLLDEFELIAVASRELNKAELFSHKFNCIAEKSYESLLARTDIDAVYIPLPTGLHEKWVCKALEANKHVFVEKSFAMNKVSGQKMINLARKKNLLILENFMFIYHRQIQEIQQIVCKESFGGIKSLHANFSIPALLANNFRYVKELGGGSLLDVGCYTLKVARYFLVNEIKILSSSLSLENNLDISGNVEMVNSTGIKAHLSFAFNQEYECSLEIYGNNTKVSSQRIFTAPKELEVNLKVEENGNVSEITLEKDNHFVHILKNFARLIQSNSFEKCYQELEEQIDLMEQIQQNSQIHGK